MYVLLTLIVTTIIIYVIWFVQKERRLRRILMKNFPSPPKKFFSGNATDFMGDVGMLKAFKRYQETYGDIVYARIGPIYHNLIFCHPDLAKEIFQGNINLTKGAVYKFTEGWLGHGLLTTEEDKWKYQRKLVSPAFNTQLLLEFIHVFDQQSDILIEKLNKIVPTDSLNIHSLLSLCSLDVICETAMGVTIEAQHNQNTEYVRAVKEMCRIIAGRSCSLRKIMKLTYIFSEDFRTERKCIKILHGFTDKVVREKRKQRKEKSSEADFHQDDRVRRPNLLDILLDYSDNDKLLSEKEIRDEVHTFMFAGHDTVTAAMSFFVYEIAKHESIQEKLYKEQQDILSEMGEKFDQSVINKMKLLDLAIKESMRLYPPVPVYTRKVTKEFIFEGRHYPEGVTLSHFAYGSHRNPKYYENPDSFDLHRFEDPKKLTTGSYLPFSLGPRNCIGQRFAMNEMKVILAKMLRNFQFRPAVPEHELEIRAEVVLTSRNGLNVKIVKREH